uniref:F-box domain-containing protein n=1 Tax=Kwoniella pini CBS 10737 TaxID=1296096 RepID=A0A1B9HZU8_9TREE|nr:uncharacterized protein I206_05598 [Kwoniella pini CBS 10737]OCF48817.1 hypothetical protein I206_05598 [Kwoniella pini CBS 10737]
MSRSVIDRLSGCPITHNNQSGSSSSTTASTSTSISTPPPLTNIASSSRPRSISPASTPLTPLSDTTSMNDLPTANTSSTFLSPFTPQLQSPLLRAPSEIIQKVLSVSGGDQVQTIAKVAKVCRELRSIIYGDNDQSLWRNIYLEHYDDPRLTGTYTSIKLSSNIDWKKRVQDRELVGKLFQHGNVDNSEEANGHSELIISTLLEMYLDLPALQPTTNSSESEDSFNSPLLSKWLSSALFKSIYERNYFLPSSSLPDTKQPIPFPKRVNRKPVDPTISRLHCLIPPMYNDESSRDREWRGHVRESVYNAANYQENNDYGPFTEDGKVDWALVDAISSVMMCNAQEIIDTEPDAWLPAVQPMSHGIEPVRGWGYDDLRRPDNLTEDDIWDWAGVEGSWCGCYAFMDYSDWAMMNHEQLGIHIGRPQNIDLSTYHEALGDLMKLELKIYRRNPLPSIETDLPKSNLLPPIYFHGSSTPYPGGDQLTPTLPQNAIRGMVTLTFDDPPQVRWTMIIRYRGQDRWRLECVQVGGRGSKRGFFGIWSDASRAEHSPYGPAWYWKV